MELKSQLFTVLRRRLGCHLFLEFRTESQDKFYRLSDHSNVHNHSLNEYDNAHAITEEIFQDIKTLKNVAKLIPELINKYDKNFHRFTINNIANQLKDGEFGKINDDAKTFTKTLENDCKLRNGFLNIKQNLMIKNSLKDAATRVNE